MKIKNKQLWFAIIAGDFIVFAVVAFMFIQNAKKEKTPETSEPPPQKARVYFYDRTMSHFVPLTVLLREGKEDMNARARSSVEKLLSGPPEDSPLSATFPDDVKLKNVDVSGDTVTVDFNKNLLKAYGAALEIGMAGSLVLTLTDIPGITKVQILCEGKNVPYLPEGTEIGNALTRSDFSDYEQNNKKYKH